MTGIDQLTAGVVGSLRRALVQAERITARRVALLDDLPAGQRAATLGLGCDRLLGLTDAAGEKHDRERDTNHAVIVHAPRSQRGVHRTPHTHE